MHWVEQRGKVDLDELGSRPVEAGRETDGTPLFIAQGLVDGSAQPGKCSTRLSSAFIAYGGTEKEVKVSLCVPLDYAVKLNIFLAQEYRVLCYDN